MIRNFTLSGVTEIDLDPDKTYPYLYLSDRFSWIKNESGETIYASADENCVPDRDGTAEIPANAVYRMDTPPNNILYVYGSGDIEITTTKTSQNPYLNAGGGGGGSGTDDYTSLSNKPKINGFTLIGDKPFEDLGLEWVKPPVIADVFDPAETYSENDFVMYNSELYKCTADHSGVWDNADFEKVTVMECISSGGGSFNIVNTPTAEQIADSIAEIWG